MFFDPSQTPYLPKGRTTGEKGYLFHLPFFTHQTQKLAKHTSPYKGLHMTNQPQTQVTKRVTIYTDGSCLNNPGMGGYCALLKYPNGKTKVVLGAELDTTNNRMELKAVIEGLKGLPKGHYSVTVVSDSQITVRGINEWLSNWIRQDFKKTKNSDLWREFIEVSKSHKVTAQWVRAHNGHPENELCDQLSREKAMELAGDYK